MTDLPPTRARLLKEAQRLFWSKGYGQVSLRDISQAAGVDVALVGRYFGSKLGLFEATLDLIDPLDADAFETREALIDHLVGVCADWPRGPDHPSPLTHLLLNGNDPDVGDLVRQGFCDHWQRPIEAVVGDRGGAALLTAVVLGMSVAEKTLRLGGVTEPTHEGYAPALRRLFTAALAAE